MRNLFLVVVTAVVLGAAGLASADNVVFSDNFNTENGGVGQLNYFGFANWTVTTGSVDLIGNGFFDFLPGNGLYVDMDGSTNQAGTMVSNAIALTAGTYDFQFQLAGDQRNAPPEPVTASVSGGLASQTYLFPSAQGFTTENLVFSLTGPQAITLGFSETGTSDQGMLLDNVSLSSVTASAGAPLPGSMWAGAVLMAGMGAMKLRRKLAMA